MNILLDTHALYWFIEGDPQLSPLARTTVSDPANEVLIRTRHAAERPGVTLKGPGGRWNLSGFTELETAVKNLGTHPLTMHCAVEGAEADRATRRNSGRDDGENFQNGFVDVCDRPYNETVVACRRIGYRPYAARAGQRD